MRLTIQREAFLKPLRLVAGVVERKHTQAAPILMNVLIEVNEKSFTLTTTDQEVELVASGVVEDAKVEKGSVTVPVRKLMDICKTLPEGENLSLVEEAGRVILRAGRSRFTLSTLPVADFPSSDPHVGDFEFLIPQKKLKTLLEKTCFAMAEQDVRYYLNGLLLEVKNNHIYGVAADGHRLAFGKVALPLEKKELVRVIVPRKGILELQRLMDEGDPDLKIILGKNHIRVMTPDAQLTSKLLDGRFPDYERLVLVDGDKVFEGQREVLKESFQRAASLFNDKFKGVHLKLVKGWLKILAKNTEQDEVEEDLEIDYQGNELEIGFNIKYLIDFLNVIQSDRVRFTFSDPNTSARIEGVGEESGIYVIMPMRI